MTEHAPATDLPSTRTLLRSTGLAFLVATVVLLVFVLPAEYGVDPTRIGGLLGLTKMGDIKTSLQAEAAGAPPPCAPVAAKAAATPPAARPGRNDVTTATLEPGASVELKLVMKEGARATYAWSTDTGAVNYDLHSDRPSGGYHGYKKGTGVQADKGELVAAFDGNHGWYWRNRGDAAVTLTLTTAGDYEAVKEFK